VTHSRDTGRLLDASVHQTKVIVAESSLVSPGSREAQHWGSMSFLSPVSSQVFLGTCGS